MTLKTKIIILICVYVAGYFTAVKYAAPPAGRETATESTQKLETKKVTKKKTYAPSGALASEVEITEAADLAVHNTLKIKEPPQIIYKRDALIADLDSRLNAGLLLKPYALIPLRIIPKDLYIGYQKSIRTGEDTFRLAYTVFTKE